MDLRGSIPSSVARQASDGSKGKFPSSKRGIGTSRGSKDPIVSSYASHEGSVWSSYSENSKFVPKIARSRSLIACISSLSTSRERSWVMKFIRIEYSASRLFSLVWASAMLSRASPKPSALFNQKEYRVAVGQARPRLREESFLSSEDPSLYAKFPSWPRSSQPKSRPPKISSVLHSLDKLTLAVTALCTFQKNSIKLSPSTILSSFSRRFAPAYRYSRGYAALSLTFHRSG
mmetsp:Transcript_19217/g.44964  ORF Transcript_19217/g.44964 Transcript_19217/m.44964 type:complete len:232 (-) Transcript_19217:1491-2186(-)